jgi:hypothetical protein
VRQNQPITGRFATNENGIISAKEKYATLPDPPNPFPTNIGFTLRKPPVPFIFSLNIEDVGGFSYTKPIPIMRVKLPGI